MRNAHGYHERMQVLVRLAERLQEQLIELERQSEGAGAGPAAAARCVGRMRVARPCHNSETRQSTGLDLHITIDREVKPMRLAFGVMLRGVMSPMTAENANKVLVPTLGPFQGMRKFTYPVCLFFFTMRDDKAYFSWLAEPVVTSGTPKLVHHAKADCVDLTDALLDLVVERVVLW